MEDTARAVREILTLVQGTGIADLEVEWPDGSLRIKRNPSMTRTAGREAPGVSADDSIVVTSAFVGMFHREPASDFPGVGDTVRAGQTIAQVETLRIQNAVTAPAEGMIVDVLAADRAPVEFGQPLLVIKPAPAAPGQD